MYSVLSAGLAKGHRANPAASLRVENVFGVSVLLSGLASLVLTNKEESLLAGHFKIHIQRLLRLHQATPDPVVFLLAGCLPFQALLHLRMISLFGQLCRLRDGDNILARHASNIFSSASSPSKSWFWKLRQICLIYSLLLAHHQTIQAPGEAARQGSCQTLLVSQAEGPGTLPHLPQIPQDRFPWTSKMPPSILDLWCLPQGGGEGHYPGEALIRQI